MLGQGHGDEKEEEYEEVDEDRAEDSSKCGGRSSGSPVKQVVRVFLVECNFTFQLGRSAE